MTPEDTGPIKHACSDYEALLEDYLAGALVGADAEKAAAHLKTCAACRAALDEATAGARLLRMALTLEQQAPQPGPAFARTVMARIRTEGKPDAQESGFWRPFVWLGWRFAATAAMAVAFLFTYATVWHVPAPENNTVAAEFEPGEMFSPDPAQPPASRDDVLIMVAGTENGKN